MLEYTRGDILKAETEALVNTVNCVGVMGRGIALQFKNAFPENFKAYAAACKKQGVQPGRMFIHETGALTPPRFIINFPTKRHWRGRSFLEDIEAGLKDLVRVIRERQITSVSVPPLGSGLGGLDWNLVRVLLEKTFKDLTEVKILVFEPQRAPFCKLKGHSRKTPAMTPGRAALLGLMRRYLAGMLDPFVTLLEIHKLMYFLQEGGEPLRLRYQKGLYGPYAANLRHVLYAIEGYFISGYADGGDAPNKQLELVPGAIQDAEIFIQNHPATRERFERVAKLVEGFESSFGLELLSTVHWVAVKEKAEGIPEIIKRTYAWNDHKRQFSERQIQLATEALASQGWLNEPEGN